jgi:hypothetical protein
MCLSPTGNRTLCWAAWPRSAKPSLHLKPSIPTQALAQDQLSALKGMLAAAFGAGAERLVAVGFAALN